MKAAICPRYGPPEVVEIREVPRPVPKPGEVLIRIHAACVNSGDVRIRGFDAPAGMGVMMALGVGLLKPRAPVLGIDLAGTVEAVGEGVGGFRPGDEVFAVPGFGTGTHAEYVTMPETGAIAPKPASLGMAESAALLFGGTTAIHFLERAAGLAAGERVLVNGASGAVGCAAVQLARHLGAHVTGVCSAANAELVRRLGADTVIDYAAEDFTARGERWDVIMDNVGNAPLSRCLPVLAEGGRFIAVVSSLAGMIAAGVKPRRGSRRVIASIADADRAMLDELSRLAGAGEMAAVIDSTFPFEDVVAAHRRADSHRKTGSVVLTFAPAGA